MWKNTLLLSSEMAICEASCKCCWPRGVPSQKRTDPFVIHEQVLSHGDMWAAFSLLHYVAAGQNPEINQIAERAQAIIIKNRYDECS